MKPLLNLTIKRRWLDKIVSGEKREEYRAPDCAQLQNLDRKLLYADRGPGPMSHPFVVLRAGYGMHSAALAVEIVCIASPIDPKKTTVIPPGPRHPEWGEPETPHFTIVLGMHLKAGTYAEVKEWFEGDAK